MNFKLFGGGLAALAFLASSFSTQAADIPRPVYKSAMRPVIAYYNWTGFYVGINGGYGFGTSNWSGAAVSPKPKGGVAGGTIGYNYQVGSWVWGLEGDFDWADVNGSAVCGGFTCQTKNSWLATFRGRIGYAFDRWMPYFTGGGAYGNVKASPEPGRVLGQQVRTRLDLRRRPRIRLPRQLERQDRISLRRSRPLRHRPRTLREQCLVQGERRSRRYQLQILRAGLLSRLSASSEPKRKHGSPGPTAPNRNDGPGLFALKQAPAQARAFTTFCFWVPSPSSQARPRRRPGGTSARASCPAPHPMVCR